MEKKDKENVMDVSSMMVGEDSTKYGEFISSIFEWDTLEGQKRKANKLENVTKKDKKNS